VWLRGLEAQVASQSVLEITAGNGTVLVNGEPVDAETAERIRSYLASAPPGSGLAASTP
jgi:hypothetical protein